MWRRREDLYCRAPKSTHRDRHARHHDHVAEGVLFRRADHAARVASCRHLLHRLVQHAARAHDGDVAGGQVLVGLLVDDALRLGDDDEEGGLLRALRC